MNRTKRTMAWVVLIIFLLILAAIFAQVDNWKRDWTTNWARTDPHADAAGMRPIHSDLPPPALRQRVLRWVAEQPHWQVAEDSDVGTNGIRGTAPPLHLIRTTRLFRFRDDVYVTIDHDDETGKSILHVESRSRIGRGDLGQNPRNIQELTAGLQSVR